MKKYRFLLLCFLFVSCQSTGFLMGKAESILLNDPYPAKSENEHIDIYITNVPENPYLEIAIISCRDTENNWCLKELKRKALELGADAIIITGKATTGAIGVPVGDMLFMTDSEYGMKGIAIKYK